MRTTLHPAGIVLGHTLPALLLALFYANILAVVHPLLEAEHVHAWTWAAASLGTVVLASTLYALFAWRTGRRVHAAYAVLVFLAYVPMLWVFGENMEDLLPSSIPRWMMPDDAGLYAFRLLCIPLVHALFVLVVLSLRDKERGAPVRDLLIAAGIPLGIYLFVQVVEPFRRSSDFEEHTWVVVFITLTIGFLFLLFRGVAAIVHRVGSGSRVLVFIVRLLIALVFPLLGLAINNGHLGTRWNEVDGIFGDLAHPAFYLIAALNGIVVIWPSSPRTRVRFVQFVLRAIGFAYVLYFFILFLPLLPLSIVAVIAIGVGFLLLAPVLLFIVQSTLLFQDLRFLAPHHGRLKMLVVLAGCLLVIPMTITIRYLHHRTVLLAALHHVYESDPRLPTEPLDAPALEAVLDQVDANRSRRWGFGGGGTPFLTPYYNRLVLNNLTISEDKMNLLRAVFFNAPVPEVSFARRMPPSANTVIDSSSVRSRYDGQEGAWHSWVDLHVLNTSGGQEEFVTEITLPDGAWIGGDYLVIGNDTVPGILAEKKAALWVYNNIVSYRRDPSMMRYTDPGVVQLRVFPVEGNATRQAGFEVVHKEGLRLLLGGDTLLLGDATHDPHDVVEAREGGAAYIPVPVKAALPRVQRTLHFDLIVDGTEAQRHMRSEITKRITGLIRSEQLDATRVTLHIADGYGTSLPYSAKALDAFAHYVGHGGFFSDRAIRKIISEACLHPGPEAPVIIILPSAPAHDPRSLGVLLDDVRDLAALLPEGDRFYVLGEDELPKLHSFKAPGEQLNNEPVDIILPMVRAWPDASAPKFYLPDDDNAEIIVDAVHLDQPSPSAEDKWQSALALEARRRAYLHRSTDHPVAWTSLVRGAFQAQVLTPTTAWMCLEDDAQRNALLKKQEEVLSGDPALDTSDQELTNMSEPDLLWLALPILLWFLTRRRST